MKRNQFIKSILGLGGAIVTLPAYSWAKQYSKFYLLQCFVRGFQYYNGPSLLKQMQVGGLLELVREPKNKYDDFAIAIHFNKKKIGFVPSESNEILSKLMDMQALELVAEITHVERKAATWENVAIAIYVLKEKQNLAASPLALSLTQLETPYYTTIKNNETITRFYYDDEDEEEYDLDEDINSDDDELLNEKIISILHSIKNSKQTQTNFV